MIQCRERSPPDGVPVGEGRDTLFDSLCAGKMLLPLLALALVLMGSPVPLIAAEPSWEGKTILLSRGARPVREGHRLADPGQRRRTGRAGGCLSRPAETVPGSEAVSP